MNVELLYFDGCPSWKIADGHLRALATELRFTPVHRLVGSPEEAEAAGLRGSPTILVDGHDPFAGAGDPFAFACRVYQTPDGPAGSPTLEQLRTALVAGS
jgi:hypothetical protein